jgi:hypothetical protein
VVKQWVENGDRMKPGQAKAKILDLWHNEKEPWRHGDYLAFFQSAQLFYGNLKRNNSDLLTFSCLGDKWGVVNRWIHEFEEYPDC